jgi:hypothetical protein
MNNKFGVLEEEFILENNFRERIAFFEKAQTIAKTEIESEEKNFFDLHLEEETP